jgi:hypothetical protein
VVLFGRLGVVATRFDNLRPAAGARPGQPIADSNLLPAPAPP